MRHTVVSVEEASSVIVKFKYIVSGHQHTTSEFRVVTYPFLLALGLVHVVLVARVGDAKAAGHLLAHIVG